jgi:hypothetical protein
MPRPKKKPVYKPTPQQLPPNYDYSQCFGIKAFCEKLDPECYLCDYIHACTYATRERNPDGRQHQVSFERYAFSREIADETKSELEPEPEDSAKDELRYTDRDMLRLLEYILNVDEYSLTLVINAISGKTRTASDLARIQNVSRQAIHRKLIDTCGRYPELKELLLGNLYRCKRIMRGDDSYSSGGHCRPRKNDTVNKNTHNML